MVERTVPRRLTFVERHRIMQCLAGEWLECGCLVGRYLTSSGSVLTIVDAPGCGNREHRVDVILAETSREEYDTQSRPGSGLPSSTASTLRAAS